MTDTTHRALAEPYSTGASWLSRALTVSAVLHIIVALVWWLTMRPAHESKVELVDIEMAPPPPKAEALPEEIAKLPESARPAEQAMTAAQPEPETPEDLAVVDAGVPDAPLDAGPKKKKKADAGIDDAGEPMLLSQKDPGLIDGGVAEITRDGAPGGDDGGAQVAAIESGSGAGSGFGVGAGVGSGVPAAIAQGSGSGAPGVDNQPAVEGAPTSAGTAANLLAYFPPGHQITALIRFDRLRKTEWEEPAEKLFSPMPDYQALFGGKQAAVAQKLDTLIISTPRPRDVNATTLVVHTSLARAQLRDLLANPDTPIKWSASKGGLFGKRSGKLFPGDKRVLLSPWKNWIVLAQPEDVPGLTAPATGNLDTIEAKAKLPTWLAQIRTIETESGDEKRGPALVLTLAGPAKRYKIPDVGLGITSLPSPQRLSLAMELVKQGWLVRGNIVFATEADATEFQQSVLDVQQRIVDSRVLSGLLKKQHALNAVTGLSMARSGARVSYATSMSIADTRMLLAAAAVMLEAYFGGQPQP